MSASSVVVGIDVAKAQVDVSVLGAKLDAQRFDNQAEGHSALTAALKPLEQGFGNLLSGLFSGGFGFANGAAFQQGLPVPFAKGGVIQSPLTFPLGAGRMGLAGERGAEAIMPLARGPDGRLGVVAQGRGGSINVVFNVTATDAESFRRSETQVAAMLARAVALGQRNL